MIDKSKLVVCLGKLEVELRKSGKTDTAGFFYRFISVITQSSNVDELRGMLEQLIHSGAMAQYANFSHKEDQLFDECYEEAKQLLASI